MDQNGVADIVVMDGQARTITVFYGGKGLHFDASDKVEVAAGASASSFALGDFNKDGRPDIAVGHHDTNEVWIISATGEKSFDEPKKARLKVREPHAHRIVTADVNNDGTPDILLAESDEAGAWVLLCDGKGGFAPSSGSPLSTGRHPYVVATGDFNNDGNMDFATPNWHDRSVSVFLGDGKGGFTAAQGGPVTGLRAPTELGVGDVTGDGNADIVVGNNGERGLQVLVGDGKGGFSLGAVHDLDSPGASYRPIVADLDGDGRLDVVATATRGADTFCCWLSQGDGRFTSPIVLRCKDTASSVCVTDLNGDGMQDLVVGTGNGNDTLVWFGQSK